MEDSKKLFLLDAYALIYRGYYAFIKNPRINSKGTDTSAILGFMNSLLEIIRTQNPDYLAVAFDKGGSITRSKMFTEYKSNRDKTPEPILVAIPYIKDILNAMKIPILEKEGYEADDVIGTVAKDAENNNFKVFMVTPDKDFAQLVSDNVFLCKPARMGNSMEIWGVSEVKEKFEVEDPEQVIDYLGMMGDSVDNIPGLPGVGDKTAKKFLKQYGSLENLLKNSHEITGKLGEKISNNKDLGVLSKKLARIILDVPIEYNLDDFELSKPDEVGVFKIFDELEFRRIKETFFKIFGVKTLENNDPSQEYIQGDLFTQSLVNENKLNLTNTKTLYQRIESSNELKYFTKKLLEQKIVAFDTETESLNSLETEIVGISFSWKSNKGFYLPIKKDKAIQLEYFNILKPFFQNKEIIKVGHNPPFTIENESDGGEELRMKYRYLDIRREPVKENLIFRHHLSLEVRNYLSKNNFIDVETPCLIKSTPEGARDFIVPSRLNPDHYYALPQSPQIFKQLLMVGGIDKYYQIVKCFRDEDLRADRQPEFTQIDCEMSFVNQEDILKQFEGLMSNLFSKFLNKNNVNFERMTYNEAIESYGIDKPDLRYGLKINEISDEVKGKGFQIFDNNDFTASIIVENKSETTRKEIDNLTEWVKRPQIGGTGLSHQYAKG